MQSKEHWEKIYQTKEINGVSWYQETPSESLNLIQSVAKNKDKKIIDIGCGKGYLADNLINLGFNNLTLLDISRNALAEIKNRVKSKSINYVESDILNFNDNCNYDIWHDRAVFHFLTIESEKIRYKEIAAKKINTGGHLIIGTFAEDGPLKCSGLEISRYSIDDLKRFFSKDFTFIESHKILHNTPFDTIQKFNFCIFKKL